MTALLAISNGLGHTDPTFDAVLTPALSSNPSNPSNNKRWYGYSEQPSCFALRPADGPTASV